MTIASCIFGPFISEIAINLAVSMKVFCVYFPELARGDHTNLLVFTAVHTAVFSFEDPAPIVWLLSRLISARKKKLRSVTYD